MKRTARQILIEAGIPAEELSQVRDPDLDAPANRTEVPSEVLLHTFLWMGTPQGTRYWLDVFEKLEAEGK